MAYIYVGERTYLATDKIESVRAAQPAGTLITMQSGARHHTDLELDKIMVQL